MSRKRYNLEYRREFIYLLLFVSTMSIIVWQRFGMNQSVVIHPSDEQPLVFRQMSEYIEGGRAIGETSLNDQGHLKIDCPIEDAGADFIFCSAFINLTNDDSGLDLSRYQTMTIDMHFESTATDTILFYLLHHPQPDEQVSYVTKTNMNAVLPKAGKQQVIMNLQDFYVPSWWMTYEGKDASANIPELTNVKELQIATGDSRFDRQETIIIEGIRFDGKWLSSTELNTGIIGFWLVVFALRFLLRYRALSRSLDKQKSSVSDLKSLNRLLDIEKKKFATMAKQDHLTKLYNRAGARDILYRVQQSYRQSEQPSSLILFDVDDFKLLNDKYGHLIGDKVLIHMAEVLEANTRNNDHVIRWGGEEFAVICEGSKLEDALQLAEKLRRTIEETLFPEDIRLTCSFGIAALKTYETHEWFEEADSNLYAAKAKGKNCTVTSEPLPQQEL